MVKTVYTASAVSLTCILLMAPTAAARSHGTAQRITAIREIYGICVECDEYGAAYIDQQLHSIEAALYQTGVVFSHRMNQVEMAQGVTPPFSIRVSNDRPAIEPRAVGYFHITTEFSIVNLYPSDTRILSEKDVLHEFGHVACYFSNGTGINVLEDFRIINGAYGGDFWDPHCYVSRYAMTNASEDFAEVFAHMVLGAGDNPATVGPGTILYQKFACTQQYLLDQLGADSRVVQKVSAFLGMDLYNGEQEAEYPEIVYIYDPQVGQTEIFDNPDAQEEYLAISG